MTTHIELTFSVPQHDELTKLILTPIVGWWNRNRDVANFSTIRIDGVDYTPEELMRGVRRKTIVTESGAFRQVDEPLVFNPYRPYGPLLCCDKCGATREPGPHDKQRRGAQ